MQHCYTYLGSFAVLPGTFVCMFAAFHEMYVILSLIFFSTVIFKWVLKSHFDLEKILLTGTAESVEIKYY